MPRDQRVIHRQRPQRVRRDHPVAQADHHHRALALLGQQPAQFLAQNIAHRLPRLRNFLLDTLRLQCDIMSYGFVEKRGTLFRGDVHFRHTDAARFPVGQMHAGQRLLIPPVERFHGQIGTNLFHCTHLPRRFCAYYVRGLSFHAICAQKLTCFLSLGLAMERLTWYHIAVNCKAWR